jgi:hypothetical protein
LKRERKKDWKKGNGREDRKKIGWKRGGRMEGRMEGMNVN